LVRGFLALGQALYLRYMALENKTVSLACQGGWVALAAAAQWCWKSHAATPIVLVSRATVPCPEPWGRQYDGAPEQAANQLKRDAVRQQR
jgi:hypothetical protein